MEEKRMCNRDGSMMQSSNELRELIDRNKIRQSMSRKDDPYDNAYAESFWSRFF